MPQHHAYFPRQDPKGVDVAGFRDSCVGQPEAFVVSQLRSGAVEEPINVHPGCIWWKKGYTETAKVGVPMSIDENIGLGECEGGS